MSSINPGVVHMRKGGILAADVEKITNRKKHNVSLGNIDGGIKTNVDIDAGNFFFAGTTRPVSVELLVKRESGVKTEKSHSSTDGYRKMTSDAESDYCGGILDFRYFGVSYSNANYEYLNMYRLSDIPTLEAYDEKQHLTYQNIKVGSAIKIGDFRIGGYYISQRAKGKYIYTPLEATTGALGTRTKYPTEINSSGIGAGVGYTLKNFRTEISLERMMSGDLKISKDYPLVVKAPGQSQRISAVVEAKLFSFLNLGLRLRRIKGNYVDLEDIIANNLLYSNIGKDDYRDEIIYNFSFGDNMGFSPSFFFMQSNLMSKERSPIYDNGQEFKARTMATSMGATLSFKF